MGSLLAPSAGGSVQLEWPQHVRHVLEVGAHGNHLVNHILDANDLMTTQVGLDQIIRSDWCPLTINLEESAFVDQLTDRLQVGHTPSDIRL